MRFAILFNWIHGYILAYSEGIVKNQSKNLLLLANRGVYTMVSMAIDIDVLKVTIGKRVRFFRIRKGMTQMELAQKIGYTSSASVSEVESGIKAPSMDKLQLIADTLDVPVSLLVTPVQYDSTDKKAALLADLVNLLKIPGDNPTFDVIHTIIKAEIEKNK